MNKPPMERETLFDVIKDMQPIEVFIDRETSNVLSERITKSTQKKRALNPKFGRAEAAIYFVKALRRFKLHRLIVGE